MYANRIEATNLGHSLNYSTINRFNIFISVSLNLSQRLLHMRCHGVVLRPFTDTNLNVLSVMADVN